ncbi:MAG: AAA family ATPase, partial [Methylomonas sp.]|nr:AAA family ATPase [Methylomonas sp.]
QAKALEGAPQLLFVSGEAGIGKTALLEHFLSHMTNLTATGRGRCVEQFGQSEPYLPLLEALNELCRRQGQKALAALAKIAPDWLAELPWLDCADRTIASSTDAQSGTQARMLRELGELLEQWSQDSPLTIVLEDIHWSDWATLDALAFLARRNRPARWLIVASYRPEQTLHGGQPLAQIGRDLLVKGLAREIALPLLPEPAVADYLRCRYGAAGIDPALISAIHRRSEGLPFFIAQLADNLDRFGVEVLETLPEGLQSLLEQQFERLPSAQQNLLNAAAVAGPVVDVPLLAALTDQDDTAAETLCETLHRGRNFLCRDQNGHYGFTHAYCHDYVYARLPAHAKALLHRRCAYYLENHVPRGHDDRLSALALHFDRGGVADKALNYLQRAVDLAIRRHAPHEVIQLARRALTLMEAQQADAGPESEQQAVRLYAALLGAIQATQGLAADELSSIYQRIALGAQRHDAGVQIAVLWSLGCFLSVQNKMSEAHEHCWQPLSRLGSDSGELAASVCAEVGIGGCALFRGDLRVADSHLQRAQALFNLDSTAGRLHPVALHPLISGYSLRTQIAWLFGFPDQSKQLVQAGVELAHQLNQAFSLAFALWNAATCTQLRGEVEQTASLCEQILALAEINGFLQITKLTLLIKGWADLQRGDHDGGLSAIRTSLNMIRESGGKLMQHFLLSYCCAACQEAGLFDEAETLLTANRIAAAEQQGEGFSQAELLRLEGEQLLAKTEADYVAAEALFREALATAEQQGAKSLALRAAISLARLLAGQERSSEGRQILQDIYRQFTQGFDTLDLRRAALLLNDLQAAPVGH